ncbi:uncharacterized protein FOMMEDRAFT_161028 [Fomitiporia mediterranea MF3/22]|uniref:uncharacterized protein n=1 Tax=Fomitiporia mediterranea (strain MF3/22) TaxID=694068 RepID=UPI0004408C50|nr:uncharacterized protein FOMMEDRAFT_161028 [Fomitiporia mediterranea MF3/22]EJC98849.1 hypothetical protein FOMMEDRAFT_161028 [Fomitiporia mediterranea MF3/22]
MVVKLRKGVASTVASRDVVDTGTGASKGAARASSFTFALNVRTTSQLQLDVYYFSAVVTEVHHATSLNQLGAQNVIWRFT